MRSSTRPGLGLERVVRGSSHTLPDQQVESSRKDQDCSAIHRQQEQWRPSGLATSPRRPVAQSISRLSPILSPRRPIALPYRTAPVVECEARITTAYRQLPFRPLFYSIRYLGA